MELVKKATQYIKDNKHIVNNTYRSTYHMEPTLGWMNDPNGLIFANGEFHLFYQSNPYASSPKNMAWGHFVSKDLIKYKEIDIALYPDGKEQIETGCFTGSCFIEDNELKMVYTKHFDGDKVENNIERQYICNTCDNVVFSKQDRPCIDENELPEELSKTDFRDPQIFYYDGRCYLIIGGRTLDHKGVFIIYSGKDSSSLHYDFYFGPIPNSRCMVECPSFVRVDGKDVVFYSSYGPTASNGVYYIVGKFNPTNKTFDIENEGVLDAGDAFYAPKIIENYELPTMIGWMENWNKTHKTNEIGHNWAGSFTIPRVLSIHNGELYQNIHPNINKYIVREHDVTSNGCINKKSLNTFTFKNDFDLVLKGEDGMVNIFKHDGYIYVDTTHSNNLHEMVFKSKNQYIEGTIAALLDTSSLELFIDNGRETISTRIYIIGDKYDVIMSNIDVINSKDIEVK